MALDAVIQLATVPLTNRQASVGVIEQATFGVIDPQFGVTEDLPGGNPSRMRSLSLQPLFGLYGDRNGNGLASIVLIMLF
jgi:hypothetical protein